MNISHLTQLHNILTSVYVRGKRQRLYSHHPYVTRWNILIIINSANIYLRKYLTRIYYREEKYGKRSFNPHIRL